MRCLVTGSAGHLGEAMVRTLRERSHDVIGLDLLASRYTDQVGSIIDRETVARAMKGVEVVFHTATLHKPHVATHSRQAFVDTNVTGTLNLLEEAVAARVRSFIFTSTTSVFGDALIPPPGEPAAWVTEDVRPIPRNIYGVTKAAAEDLCELFHRNQGLMCLILRTSRFFPEPDDDREKRESYADDNLKTNEFLCRRVELGDVVESHLLAAEHAERIGFRRYIISATTPFSFDDRAALRSDAPSVVRRRFPSYEAEYRRRGWRMFSSIDRVYVNARARDELGWKPRYDFQHVIDRLKNGDDHLGPLAKTVGSKGYHAERFEDGPYPVE